jgi:hypothetical protein
MFYWVSYIILMNNTLTNINFVNYPFFRNWLSLQTLLTYHFIMSTSGQKYNHADNEESKILKNKNVVLINTFI